MIAKDDVAGAARAADLGVAGLLSSAGAGDSEGGDGAVAAALVDDEAAGAGPAGVIDGDSGCGVAVEFGAGVGVEADAVYGAPGGPVVDIAGGGGCAIEAPLFGGGGEESKVAEECAIAAAIDGGDGAGAGAAAARSELRFRQYWARLFLCAGVDATRCTGRPAASSLAAMASSCSSGSSQRGFGGFMPSLSNQ